MKKFLMASAFAVVAVPAFAQSEASMMTCADYLGQDQDMQMETAGALHGGGMMSDGDGMMAEDEGMMAEGEGMMAEGEGMMAEDEGMMAEGGSMMSEEDMEAEDGEMEAEDDGDELAADLAAACDGHPDMMLGDAMEAMGNM